MADRRFTDVELERSLAGDLPAARAQLVDRDATDADRARLAELRAERDAYLAGIDVDAEVRLIRARASLMPAPRRWWRWALPAVLAAAAAAIFVFVIRPKGDDDDVLVKGEPVTLTIHRAEASGSRPLASGDVVHPGDRIRFEVTAAKKGYIAIVGLDGSGATTVYFPFASSVPVDFDPAAGPVLPGAIQLDATPGDERFFAIYALQPFSIDTVITQLRARRAFSGGITAAEVILHKVDK
jgi:hypothetical protein